MNQTENHEQTTQQNKTIWKLAVAAFVFGAMFFGANALAGQNVLINIVCALVLVGAAVFCGRKISSHHKFTTREVAFIGMMSAIVFVSNYISFTIPLAIGGCRRTLCRHRFDDVRLHHPAVYRRFSLHLCFQIFDGLHCRLHHRQVQG